VLLVTVSTPITKSFHSYRIETSVLDPESNTILNDIEDHKMKALSYIIHSIDAAIIQRFIRLMRDRCKYTINTLHDCVLLHPNYVPHFYDLVYEVFTSKDLYNVAFTCIFDVIRSDLSSTSIPILDHLEQQYKDNCHDFFDELKNLKPRFLYKPES
jgi:hypothetical protein